MTQEESKRSWWSWFLALFHWSGSEQIMIDYCNHLLTERPKRKPMVFLYDESTMSYEVASPPEAPGGDWVLSGGRCVKYEDIEQLDSADVMLGYV